MIEIAPAITKPDFTCVEELANTIWRKHYIPIVGESQVSYMLDKFQSADAIEGQVNAGYEYFLLNYNQKAAGYISIKREENALFLSKLYVLSSYRGKKIGKKGMQFIEEKAKRYGLKCIRLTVNIHNTNSIKAYEKLGFVNSGPTVADIGNGYIMDDYLMVKTL